MGTLALCGNARAVVQPTPDWFNRVHIGGSAAVRYMDGQRRAVYERNRGFNVFQADVILDVDITQKISFWYDMSVLREGISRPLEQIFIRCDNIFNQEWLNAKIGRTFTPYGEDYLRWHQIDNPLASQTASFTWALDEGVVFFGDILSNERLSYAASLQNGNGTFNFDDNNEKTVSLKLFSRPISWLYVSGTYLRLDKQGNEDSAARASSEWWLSGFHLSPLGATTAASGASSSRVISGHAFEGDVKAENDLGRVFLQYGGVNIQDGSGEAFDRHIRYFTGELLGNIPRTSQKAYAVARFSTVGTYDPNVGYRFAGTEIAIEGNANNSSPNSAFNYNQRELFRYTFGGGYRIHKNCLVKAEYSIEETQLIESAKSAANLDLLGLRNFFIAEIAVQF